MTLIRFSEYFNKQTSILLVWYIPFDLCRPQNAADGLWGFYLLIKNYRSSSSPITFHSPLEFDRLNPLVWMNKFIKNKLLSWGFSSLQRNETRVHSPWDYLSQYVPLSGFLILLAVYSSNHLEVLFHTSSTREICPPEFSPWKQHRTLVEYDYSAWVAWKKLCSSENKCSY